MVARRRPTGQDIQQIKLDLVGTMSLIIGIDVAKDWHYAQILSGETGRPVGRAVRIENTRGGFDSLAAAVSEALATVKVSGQGGSKGVIVGMESTGVYWKPLAHFCADQGWTVVMVNPYHVKQLKEVQDNSPTKSDPKDAMVIAKLVRDGHFLTARLPKGVYQELRALVDQHHQQREDRSRAINRLKTALAQYFPEFPNVFRDVGGKGALWVLEHVPLPSDVLSMTEEDLAQGIGGGRRLERKRARRLQEAAQQSIGIRGAEQAFRAQIQAQVRALRYCSEEGGKTEELLRSALESAGETSKRLQSIPGVGPLMAAQLLGWLGNPGGYEHPRQMGRMAGLNLSHQSSGQKNGQRHISKRGSARLRGVLYQAAMLMVRHSPDMAAWYRNLKERPENPLKSKSALLAVARKLLSIIHAMEHSGQTYQPQRVQRRAPTTAA